MRRCALILLPLVGACSTAPAETSPVHGVTPGHKCEASGVQQFVGQEATKETGAAIKRASNAAVLRWAPPGVMLTMDFREDRVTIHYGPDRKITKVNCG